MRITIDSQSINKPNYLKKCKLSKILVASVMITSFVTVNLKCMQLFKVIKLIRNLINKLGE